MSDSQKAHELVHNDPDSVGEKDVVFDCLSCGKSLVVDRVAAGHALSCPQCGKEVKVPEAHRVVTLAEAPETQKLQAKPEWEQELISIESAIKETRHQREEAANFHRHHASEANRLEVRIEKKDPGLGKDAADSHKHQVSEANRQRQRMERLDARLKELEARRAGIHSEHKG